MANHIRQQIRERVGTTLTGLTTTGSNVYQSRVYNLEDSIREMITMWSKRNSNENLEYIKKGEKEFKDKRGKISNYELPEPINLVGYIEQQYFIKGFRKFFTEFTYIFYHFLIIRFSN